ncbi:glycosyltransferase [uncultured Cyclobacterium sp.]|uniref:glycosyltransferase n=1 Tax=uncultured Cyclobacterium sp. TaxID=453820 RepID=UPI0030EF07E0
MSFKHFLLTRFNVAFIERCNAKKIDPDVWLKNRLELFFKTCVPSVCNQENKNFSWIIYLDYRTDINYIRQIESKISSINHHLILLNGDFDILSGKVVLDIKLLMDHHVSHIITSRIDSDDLISKKFTNNIQSLFDYQDYLPVNYDKGYLYHNSKYVLGVVSHKCNPFISLIEKIDSNFYFKTVWYKKHTDYYYDKSTININNTDRMWCMIIHNNNVSSGFFAIPLLFKEVSLNDSFGYKFQKFPTKNSIILLLLFYFKRKIKMKLLALKFYINKL